MPIIILAVATISSTASGSLPPISPTSPAMLKAHSVPEALISIYQIIWIVFFSVAFLTPISSLIAGVALLKLKKWARKFTLWVFSIIVGTKLISFSVALFHPYLRTITYSNIARNLGFVLFLLFEIIIIWILIFKVKPITNRSSGR